MLKISGSSPTLFGTRFARFYLNSDMPVSSYQGAYRKYARLFDVPVQYCMAHLIREICFLVEHSIKKLTRWGHQLLGWLKKLFKTLHRRTSAQTISVCYFQPCRLIRINRTEP